MCGYDAVTWSPYTQKDITCVEFRSASRSGYPVTSPPRNVHLKTSVWKEFFRFKFTMKFKGVSSKWQYEPTFIRKAVGFLNKSHYSSDAHKPYEGIKKSLTKNQT